MVCSWRYWLASVCRRRIPRTQSIAAGGAEHTTAQVVRRVPGHRRSSSPLPGQSWIARGQCLVFGPIRRRTACWCFPFVFFMRHQRGRQHRKARSPDGRKPDEPRRPSTPRRAHVLSCRLCRAEHTSCRLCRAEHTSCRLCRAEHTSCRLCRAEHTSCHLRRAGCERILHFHSV